MTDVFIAGGGVAGATAALLLSRAGREVLLLERTPALHDKVCGEFISADTGRRIEDLGISLHELGGTPIDTVRLVGRDLIAERPLPSNGWAINRRLLDEALLDRARRNGSLVERGFEIRKLSRSCQGWEADFHGRFGNTGRHKATTCFLATGKHDLTGWNRSYRSKSNFVAFKMYFSLSPKQRSELGNAVELVLFAGGYCGISMLDRDVANLSLLIEKTRLHALGKRWGYVLEHLRICSPFLRDRLEGAIELLPYPLAVTRLPFGHIAKAGPEGLWPIGDQSAVIPSFTGGGIGIAVQTAALAAKFVLEGKAVNDFYLLLQQHLRRPVAVALSVSTVMTEWPIFARILTVAPQLLDLIYSATRVELPG